MSYTVIVSANGSCVEQVQSARRLYREVLDKELGYPRDLRPYLVAWEKSRRGDSLTETEVKQSSAWIHAQDAARIKAIVLLRGADGTFDVKLCD